eukprot:Nitzschia sp. Nitz4//scaffold13_size275219//234692//235830//NITZ4_000918-RA/size275219-snap-gene-0.23-mRNA-1//1//CDS//3329536146//3953//frame0
MDNAIKEIPQHLKIRILHQTDDCVIIEKPCNLRSVPGHDKSNQSTSPFPQRTAQEAWVLALQSFSTNPSSAYTCLQRLAEWDLNRLSSVPRRLALFSRFVERNAKSLDLDHPSEKDIQGIFQCIQKRQKPLMNLPPSTPLLESAYGQLTKRLGGESETDSIRVVHRLDCETSGVMVFARTQQAASKLSKAWREGQVQKTYLAVVNDWPAFQKHGQTNGVIENPLEPDPDNQLQWRVASPGTGKPSQTEWKLVQKEPLVLELRPLTGRTHQLRVHCAHVSGGIRGDSLYGASAKTKLLDSTGDSFLHLHACQLQFPDPATLVAENEKRCQFECYPPWYKGTSPNSSIEKSD